MATAWMDYISASGGQLMAPKESALQVALGFDGIPWIVSTQRSCGAGNVIKYYNETCG